MDVDTMMVGERKRILTRTRKTEEENEQACGKILSDGMCVDGGEQ